MDRHRAPEPIVRSGVSRHEFPLLEPFIPPAMEHIHRTSEPILPRRPHNGVLPADRYRTAEMTVSTIPTTWSELLMRHPPVPNAPQDVSSAFEARLPFHPHQGILSADRNRGTEGNRCGNMAGHTLPPVLNPPFPGDGVAFEHIRRNAVEILPQTPHPGDVPIQRHRKRASLNEFSFAGKLRRDRVGRAQDD